MAQSPVDIEVPARLRPVKDELESEPQPGTQARRLLRNASLVTGLVIAVIIVLMSAAAPLITHFDPTAQDPNSVFLQPTLQHLMGTDQFGRDLFARVLYGGRYTMVASFLAVCIGLLFGAASGVIAGFFGGAIEMLIMRVMDLLLAFPGILLALAITTILSPGLVSAVIAIGAASVPTYARVLQAATLRVRGLPYVDAAQALGVSRVGIIWRHIVPNVLSQIVVLGTVWLGTATLWVAALGFLGLGLQPPTPEWGAILNSGRDYITLAWWISVFPGVLIALYVIGVNLIGDGLRDVLDPSLV